MIKQKTITIKTKSGDKEIKALVIGNFAVHFQASWDDESNEFFFNEEWYSVSHIETGLSIMRIIETKDAAIDFARRANRHFYGDRVARTLAGDKPEIDAFVNLITQWSNEWGIVYQY